MTTTLTPEGADFRGYWLNPNANSWSRISCLAGQTATVVDQNQGCCYTDPSEPCTVATGCKDNTLHRSVLWTPTTSAITHTPCGNNECLARLIYGSPEKPSDLKYEWLCDTMGLGRIQMYETVTGLAVTTASTTIVHGSLSAITAFSTFMPGTFKPSNLFPTQTSSSPLTIASSMNSSSNSTQHDPHGMSNQDNVNLAIGMGVGAAALVALIAGLIWQWKKWRYER